ncbi:transcription factor 7-like [Syngnathus acus]|uniref:transcription factor 7-like n=1 Tax=Syngnathus acus TaxID=161584 RepID=UPI001885E2C7|nr:transcription factor 7-like [Syngnathus acus]
MDRDDLSDQLVSFCDQDMMGDTPSFLPSPNLPSLRDPPAESIYTELRTVEGEVDGSGVWFPLGRMLEVPAPMMTMTPILEPLCCPGLMLPCCQGLSLPYDWHESPFDYQLEEEPAMMMTQPTIGHANKNMPLRSQFPCVAAPPKSPTALGEREDRQDKKSEKYVKKPLNAFMLFRQEQRPKVVALLNIRNSANVNKVVGQMWKSLTKKQQRKYYELADAAKLIHTQQHPDWSCTENYGKKRKRQRVKVKDNGQEDTFQAARPDAASNETHAIKQDSHPMATNPQLRVMLEVML